MCINYDKALTSARSSAAKAKDGKVKISGIEYKLTFSHTHWHYTVTCGDDFIVNLNVKSLAKAKSELKAWLA